MTQDGVWDKKMMDFFDNLSHLFFSEGFPQKMVNMYEEIDDLTPQNLNYKDQPKLLPSTAQTPAKLG